MHSKQQLLVQSDKKSIESNLLKNFKLSKFDEAITIKASSKD